MKTGGEIVFRDRYVRPNVGSALVVGSKVYAGREDDRRLFSKKAGWRVVMGVDLEPGEGVDLVHNLENGPLPDRFTHIECLSVLEHSRRPWALAEGIIGCLAPKGTLFVHAPTVWRFHGYPSDYWRFTSEGIKSLFEPLIQWQHLMYGDKEGNFFAAPRFPHFNGGWYKSMQIFGFGIRK